MVDLNKEPQLMVHTLKLYDYMLEHAEPMNVTHISILVTDEQLPTIDYESDKVFTGNITKVFDELKISRAHYSVIRRVLLGTGAIEFLQKGNSAQPSVIRLGDRPTWKDFTRGRANGRPKDLTERTHLATLVAELQSAVDALTAWRLSLTAEGTLNVTQAIRNHEKRINTLEKKTGENSA